MEEKEFNQIVAGNLSRFRKLNHLTQSEVAEKLCYSDKAISKWERGESLPDTFILTKIAELYNVRLQDLISAESTVAKIKTKKHNQIIPIISSGIAVLVAVVTFALLTIFNVNYDNYLCFIYMIPVVGIIMTVFYKIYKNKVMEFIAIMLIIWGICLSMHLSLLFVNKIFILYCIAGTVQILEILWFVLKKQPKH